MEMEDHRHSGTQPINGTSLIGFVLSSYEFSFTVGVAGLDGCTSLIVHSTKGVWMSHFWEDPSFIDINLGPVEQQSPFQKQIINILGDGDGTPGFPGLSQFIGEGKAFGPETHVQATIITPRVWWNPEKGVLLYPDQATQIAATVTRLFGGRWDLGNPGTLAAPVFFSDYTPAKEDYMHVWGAKGKAIFQYTPLQGQCTPESSGKPVPFAQERLWHEDEPFPVKDYFWPALPEQVVANPNQRQRFKPRGLLLNDTGNEQDHANLGERQEPWILGVQPSFYPSCLAAVENTGTGSTTPLTTLFPTITSTTTVTSAVPPRVSTLCNNGRYYRWFLDCVSGCWGGHCKNIFGKKVKIIILDPPEREEWQCVCA